MLKYLPDVVTLQLDVNRCNGCGMCVTVCPHAVFAVKDRKANYIDKEACIECGACAINCPVNAIRVQTGAGCATGVLMGAIGIDSCCSGGCGVSPSVSDLNNAGCCGHRVENKGPGTSGSLTSVDMKNKKEMGKRFIIYESAMCCASGVCEEGSDQSLVRLQDALEEIRASGAEVERYGLTQDPGKFKANPDVLKLMRERQVKALPITTMNGRIMKAGSYPGLAELQKFMQDGNADLLSPADSEACCSSPDSGKNGCCTGQDCP